MRVMDMFWASNPEWSYFDEELVPQMKDDAPKEAKESYHHYMQQLKETYGKKK